MSAVTQSVLDAMTAGILDRKAGKSVKAGLTPVKGEQQASTPAPLDRNPASVGGDVFPYDGGLIEQVAHVHRQVRMNLATMEEAMRSIERACGLPEGGAVVETKASSAERERLEQQAREREADERVRKQREMEAPVEEPFPDRYKRLQEEAQSSAFAGSAAPGWACPTHGASAVEQKTSRKGRTYRVCSKCPEFEK